MTLGEKIYTLRKRAGLSQEALAEKLEVSRQAVSKWETDRALPEPETLVALSDCFRVSLDQLMRQDAPLEPQADPPAAPKAPRKPSRGRWLCLAGVLGLVLWAALTAFLPEPGLADSAAITLDGNGIFCGLCLGTVLLGFLRMRKDD